MSSKPDKPDFKGKLPDGAFHLSHNGPPKVTQPTMNVAGQLQPSAKVSASPPPPPKKSS